MSKQEEMPAIKAVLADIPTSGIIELKAVYFKDSKARIEPTKNSTTGRLLGVPVLSDDEKKLLTYFTTPETFFYVKDGYRFDLSNFEERMMWAMAKPSPLIAGSFELAQSSKDAMFYVVNEEEEVKKDLEHEDKLFQVLTYIHKDRDEELIARARLLGVDMTGEPAATAKKYLLKVTREQGGVDKLLGVYASNTVATTILFYKACDRGIIKNKNNVFMYGSMPLGADEDQVITYLQSPNNLSLVDQIKKEINPEVFGETAADASTGTTRKKQ